MEICTIIYLKKNEEMEPGNGFKPYFVPEEAVESLAASRLPVLRRLLRQVPQPSQEHDFIRKGIRCLQRALKKPECKDRRDSLGTWLREFAEGEDVAHAWRDPELTDGPIHCPEKDYGSESDYDSEHGDWHKRYAAGAGIIPVDIAIEPADLEPPLEFVEMSPAEPRSEQPAAVEEDLMVFSEDEEWSAERRSAEEMAEVEEELMVLEEESKEEMVHFEEEEEPVVCEKRGLKEEMVYFEKEELVPEKKKEEEMAVSEEEGPSRSEVVETDSDVEAVEAMANDPVVDDDFWDTNVFVPMKAMDNVYSRHRPYDAGVPESLVPGVDLSKVPFIVYDADASSASESDYDEDDDFWA